MSLTKIKSVDAHSPAQRAGVRPGETLTHINGRPIVDVLDYKFFAYDPRLELTLVGEDGRSRTLRVRKAEGEELGLNFETYLMDKARSCANRCIFCFVDQMPPGMRETLYFKDDDARLSFLMGNYITLTNMSEREIARIAELRISPINISVHATDPALREAMLKHRRAGECLATMERFAAAGITMNCQIVACPGVNDGPALDRTLRELGALHPAVGSVAVVPVGVTRFREGLYRIDPYTPAQAAAVLDQVEAFAASFLKKHSTHLAWCSDEFYLLAGRPLPEKGYYEDMAQLENGVGMMRMFINEFNEALEDVISKKEYEELAGTVSRTLTIATGKLTYPTICGFAGKLMDAFPHLTVHVYAIRNDFFGETITVSGLITGQDLIGQLKERQAAGEDLGEVLQIPSNMLRVGEQVFLDDLTVRDVERELGMKVVAVESGGREFIDAILDPEYRMERKNDNFVYIQAYDRK